MSSGNLRANALDQREGEDPSTYITRVYPGIVMLVMLHLFKEGHTACPVIGAGLLKAIQFDVYDNRIEVSAGTRPRAIFYRSGRQAESSMMGSDFEGRVCILGCAIAVALLEWEVQGEFTFAPAPETLSPLGSRYLIRKGSVTQTAPRVTRLVLTGNEY